MIFRDRREGGKALAELLLKYAGRDDAIVLALPRGGVPVGDEVAKRLGVPFDIFIVRKLGVPGQPELPLGAIASGGVRVLDQDVVRALEIPLSTIEAVAKRELQELGRREHLYRGERPEPELARKTVILVDDGLATGSSMRSAVSAVRQQRPARIVVAVPVAARQTCEALQEVADEVVCAATPAPFFAVGQWYDVFDQTSDDEVRELLEYAHARERAAA
jgi:putative phosphoribosyl transferase